MSTPKLLSPTEYVASATKKIDQAREKITLVTMMMASDGATEALFDALSRAAKRGVHVEIAADVFTFGELGGHLKPYRYYTKRSRQTSDMSKRLVRDGAKFTWLGKLSTSPFSGRNHMKCLVVDDVIYSFGGVNLDSESLTYGDYMFEVRDRQLAQELRDDIARIIEADHRHFAYRSHEFSFGKDSKVLIDGGLQGDSIIYRRACSIVKDAQSVLYVSQYCPTNKMSRLLKKATSRLYFNQPKRANRSFNKLLIGLSMLLSGNKSKYRRSRYLHAKFIIATMKDGRKIALTGSHNFTYVGVAFGTREIALETTNPKIIAQLEHFFETSVK